MLPFSLYPAVYTATASILLFLLVAPIRHKLFTFFWRLLGLTPSRIPPNPPVHLLALPDDVVLDIFLTLDLLSIMALRQTCRRCFRLSKTPSLWIRMAKWITTLHPNILATLGKPITSYSSEEVEALVTQAVRVERGWSRTCASPPQPSSSFNPEHSWACALCPGGRWFIAGTADRSGRVLYYDLENPELDGQTLLTFDGLDGADARELALQTVQTSGEPSFELAVVFGTAARYTRPDVDKRVMTLWRVTIDSIPPGLSSHLWHTMDVYQNAARRERSLSLAHEHIARLSMHRSGATIVSLYRLSQPMPVVPDVLMLTTKLEDSQGVCIVHDQRILACFDTRIGLYPQPTLPWRGSGPLPQGLSEAKPQWIYSLQTAYEGWLMGMSTPWYNGEGILSISIFDGVGLHILSLEKDGLGIPHVQTLPLERQSPKAQICLGTFRGLQSTWKSQGLERMTIMDASGLAALRYFAGVKDGTLSRRPAHAVVDLNPCPTTSPSTNEYCHVDEQSGIILFPIRGWSPLYHVFRLAE